MGIHGRGTFALRDFDMCDVVEICPALFLDKDAEHAFGDYFMSFGKHSVLPLGAGAMCNSPSDPHDVNVYWQLAHNLGAVAMVAAQSVGKDSELLIEYGSNYWN